MAERRYYWIKLHSNFMNSDAVDFLMSQKNGAEYVVLYQKLCFMTIHTNGELARMIGEILMPYNAEKIQRDCKHFSIDTVRVALELYKQLGLIYMQENGVLKIADYDKMVGGECESAERVRQFRENKRALQCNKNVTIEIDIDKEIDKEIDIYKEKEIKEKVAVAPSRSQFVKPSLEQIKAYCNERGNYISAEAFFNHYESNGWKVGKTAMKDWQSAVRGWEVRHKQEHPEMYEKPKNTAQQVQQSKEDKASLRRQKLMQDGEYKRLNAIKGKLSLEIGKMLYANIGGQEYEDKLSELESVKKSMAERETELC